MSTFLGAKKLPFFCEQPYREDLNRGLGRRIRDWIGSRDEVLVAPRLKEVEEAELNHEASLPTDMKVELCRLLHLDRRGCNAIWLSLIVMDDGRRGVVATARVRSGSSGGVYGDGMEWTTSICHGSFSSYRSNISGCESLGIKWNFKGDERYSRDHY